MKKIIIFVILLGILGGGCMIKDNSTNITKDEIIAVVNKKYDEVFIPTSLVEKNWAYNYDTLRVYPEGKPEESFSIQHIKSENGDASVKDAYFGVLIKNDYQKKMEDIIKTVFKKNKVYTSFGDHVFSNALTKETVVDEIYEKDTDFSSDNTIFISQENLQSEKFDTIVFQKIANKLIEEKLVSTLNFYLIDNTTYVDLNSENYSEFLSRPVGELDHYHFMIDSNLEYYDFNEGSD